jgi:hypothetical protein
MEGGFLAFFEELNNIENRVAWFLQEICARPKKVCKNTMMVIETKMQIFFCGGYCEQDDDKWEN